MEKRKILSALVVIVLLFSLFLPIFIKDGKGLVIAKSPNIKKIYIDTTKFKGKQLEEALEEFEELEVNLKVKGFDKTKIIPYAPKDSLEILDQHVITLDSPPPKNDKNISTKDGHFMVTFRFKVLNPESADLVLRDSSGEDFAVSNPFKSIASQQEWEPLILNAITPPPPRVGTRKPVVLLVDFPDRSGTSTASFFANLLFSKTTSRYSMRDYFYDVSYAKLDVNGATYGWIRLPKTFEYYNYYTSEDFSRPHFNEFINDVITLSDPIVNYANHDGDNDGYIDGIIIIYAGPLPPNSQWAKGLWPCMTWLNYDLDGKKTDTCTVQSEYQRDPGDTNIGVFCHEYSHTLGARDFYDCDFDSKGLGIWSLMSDGWSKQYIDPWHRYYMGWVTPVDVSSSNTYTVNQAENVTEDNTVYRVWIKPPNEYFLLENRQKLWWDSVLPGSGLLIYHIDEAVTTNNDKQWYPGYTSFGHYFCALEQADGNFDLEKNVNWGDSGDPWPGSTNKTSFNTDTTPNTFGYNGQDNIISFSNITNNGSTVSVNINVSTPFVTLLYPNGGETLTGGSTINVTW
ncbi:MAG: M6 family metalloprotease domain-containing protein, partial [Dictyoglomus turgidum]